MHLLYASLEWDDGEPDVNYIIFFSVGGWDNRGIF